MIFQIDKGGWAMAKHSEKKIFENIDHCTHTKEA
jgi:hypothetical protein